MLNWKKQLKTTADNQKTIFIIIGDKKSVSKQQLNISNKIESKYLNSKKKKKLFFESI